MPRPANRPKVVDHTVKVRLTTEQKAKLRTVATLTGRSESKVLSDVWAVFVNSIEGVMP